MKAFLLLVTWLAYNHPPSHYQVPFSSNEPVKLLVSSSSRTLNALGRR
jgi:hypothetical protein